MYLRSNKYSPSTTQLEWNFFAFSPHIERTNESFTCRLFLSCLLELHLIFNGCTFCMVGITAAAAIHESDYHKFTCVVRKPFRVFGGKTCSLPFSLHKSKIDYTHEHRPCSGILGGILRVCVCVFLVFGTSSFPFSVVSRTCQPHAHTIQWYTCTKTLDLTAKIDRSARRCSLSMKICFSSLTRRTDCRTRSTERLIAAVQFSRS